MASSAVGTLPRKKRGIHPFIAGVFVLPLGIIFYQLGGPNPPIIFASPKLVAPASK